MKQEASQGGKTGKYETARLKEKELDTETEKKR